MLRSREITASLSIQNLFFKVPKNSAVLNDVQSKMDKKNPKNSVEMHNHYIVQKQSL